MQSLTTLSHDFLKPVLHGHAICLDATLGHGRDTLFFLKQGVHRVFAYEIQPELFEKTRQALDSSKLSLFLKDHVYIEEDLKQFQGKLDAVIFNFGYDPKNMKNVHTQASSSLKAVQGAISLLRKRGRMALVFYPHPQGCLEYKEIMAWLSKEKYLEILEIAHPFKENVPKLICIEKNHERR